MEQNKSEYDELKSLEESLWVAQSRFNHDYIDNIFADDFF